jgi:hypothetical protein
MNAPHPEFRSRYAPDSSSEVDALRLEVERLRDFMETRTQIQERLLRSMLLESQVRIAESVEPRIQLAAQEAMAFAHRGLERQESTLRALGRRFAEFARETPPAAKPEAPAADIAAYAIGPAGDEAGVRAIPLAEDSEEAWLRDAANLPIAPGGASRLLATHIIEHIAPAALETRVLPHWRSRLAAGGELVVVTLDGPAYLADLTARTGFASWRERLFSSGARALRNLLDAPALAQVLERVGFTPAEPRRDGLALRIIARK